MALERLPIDDVLADVVARVKADPALVLEAPPGAGKTTRVPRALLDAGFGDRGEIVVLEPRRLAARLAARRVADELGEKVGERIGYQVRFEDFTGPKTRVRFVTEGVLGRRLLSNPTLAGVSVVLLDEFHERHLQGDVALAMLRRLQLGPRPDLRLVVMSATLDADPIAQFLGAGRVRAEGRRFDVAIEHAPHSDERPLAQQVAGAVRRLVNENLDGDVLVFLPGAGEIRRAEEACRTVAESANLLVLPLHGELSPEEQDRAIRKADRRKVILSTNVAETSVTIDGVVAVIDGGLARQAGHSAWSGFPTLKIGKVSKSSATQRAGRAGRTRPGRAIRLYTKLDFDTRPAFEEPEVRRLDLAQTLLEVHAAGADPRELPWFEAPSKAGLEAAESLLERLGAIAKGKLTEVGRRMSALPVHPRLARLVVEAEARGSGRDGCALAALLGERDVRSRDGFGSGPRKADTAVDSDPLQLLELYLASGGERARNYGLDPNGVRAVDRARRQLERASRASTNASGKGRDDALKLALLAAFPDRVARRRESAGTRAAGLELVFADGGSARLGEESGVRASELVVAVDAEDRVGRGGLHVRSASAIEEEWLLDLFPDRLVDAQELEWNKSLERVEAVTRLTFGALVLDERATTGHTPEIAARLLKEAKAAGAAGFVSDAEALDRLVRRTTFVAKSFPESGVLGLDDAAVGAVLAELCEGRRSFRELREAPVLETLRSRADPKNRLDSLAPDHVMLPGGRRVRVNFEVGQAPWIESRLQDFFGLATGPSLGQRVPLVLHLLAPNHRAVQVTTDLAGFWDRHYATIRKELMRRYPRHSWPEDPRTAPPTGPGRR